LHARKLAIRSVIAGLPESSGVKRMVAPISCVWLCHAFSLMFVVCNDERLVFEIFRHDRVERQ
jgi:hypothetical protein